MAYILNQLPGTLCCTKDKSMPAKEPLEVIDFLSGHPVQSKGPVTFTFSPCSSFSCFYILLIIDGFSFLIIYNSVT